MSLGAAEGRVALFHHGLKGRTNGFIQIHCDWHGQSRHETFSDDLKLHGPIVAPIGCSSSLAEIGWDHPISMRPFCVLFFFGNYRMNDGSTVDGTWDLPCFDLGDVVSGNWCD